MLQILGHLSGPQFLRPTPASQRSTETTRLIRDGEKGGEGGMEVGGRWRLYTCRYTLTTGMTPALSFNVSLIVRDKVTI